jgi:hypothetical protein
LVEGVETNGKGTNREERQKIKVGRVALKEGERRSWRWRSKWWRKGLLRGITVHCLSLRPTSSDQLLFI